MIELWFYRNAVIVDIDGYSSHRCDILAIVTLDRFGYTAILDRTPRTYRGRERLLEQRVTISATLDKSDVEKLDKMPGSNRSDKLRNLIRREA
jgi:hypothetical protein